MNTPVDEPLHLSRRQLECLRRIAGGETSLEVARALGLSLRTVDHYIQSACAKLCARSRTQAVVKAIQCGLISLDGQQL
jgi:DNA-binding CsgD family transcriptional regulator